MGLDFGVENGLGDGGIVDLGVAVTAVADEVDEHVRAELVAVFESETADADHGFGVFRVDVEDGDGQALGEIAGKASAGVVAGIGGEAEQVIDDDVDGSADFIGRQIAHVEGFGPDALAGKGGVAMHQDGQGLALAFGTAAGLLGARRVPARPDRRLQDGWGC